MTELELAVEHVHMTILSAKAMGFKQAMFNVGEVERILTAYTQLANAVEEVLRK